jgi:hypothetical protein
MRRMDFLVSQVRNSTDNKDVNGISTAEIVGYFNDAQKYITTLIFKNNPYADFFKVQVAYAANSTGVYTIPDDCYSTNAVSMVELLTNNLANVNDGYTRIKPIMESEFAYIGGYTIRNNTLCISGTNQFPVRLTYFKRLQTLDVRQSKVSAVVASTSIALTAPIPTDLFIMDDHCSTVDAQGDQVVANIYFTNTSGSPLLTATTTGVTTSQYIVAGANATNKSQLPDECESYMLEYVRQKIYTRNNYEDANKQMYFTEQRQNEVIAIFSKNKKDDDTIPVTDFGFLLF